MSDAQPIINIWGEKVALGPLRRDLLPLYTRWVNDFEVIATLGLALGATTFEKEEAWYESARNPGDGVQFTIYVRETMQPIGTTGLTYSFQNQRGTFGIMIGDKTAWNKGYGTEASRLMLDYGFNKLGLHHINLTVHSTNTRGIRAYEKAGYKIAGRLRESFKSGHKFVDVVYMDCLEREFNQG
jgi:RimJ/RimL family protein N-acetyltransferase